MPMFNFKCNKCTIVVRLLTDKEPQPFVCHNAGTCDGVLHREFEGPTRMVTEIKDDGYMPKRIEQVQDMENLIQERNNAPKKG